MVEAGGRGSNRVVLLYYRPKFPCRHNASIMPSWLLVLPIEQGPNWEVLSPQGENSRVAAVEEVVVVHVLGIQFPPEYSRVRMKMCRSCIIVLVGRTNALDATTRGSIALGHHYITPCQCIDIARCDLHLQFQLHRQRLGRGEVRWEVLPFFSSSWAAPPPQPPWSLGQALGCSGMEFGRHVPRTINILSNVWVGVWVWMWMWMWMVGGVWLVYICVCRLIVGGFGLKVQASRASGLGEKKRRVTRWSGRKQ